MHFKLATIHDKKLQMWRFRRDKGIQNYPIHNSKNVSASQFEVLHLILLTTLLFFYSINLFCTFCPYTDFKFAFSRDKNKRLSRLCDSELYSQWNGPFWIPRLLVLYNWKGIMGRGTNLLRWHEISKADKCHTKIKWFFFLKMGEELKPASYATKYGKRCVDT